VARADKEVLVAMGKAFASDRALAGTQIKYSVNNGGVLLTGEARTLSEHLVAIEAARMVKGVTSVATQVKSPRDLTDDEIADGRAIRAGRDVFITTAVKLRMIADRAVPTADVKVDSRYGMVVLFGTVPTDSAKAAAGRDARKVKGVDRVLNDLQVVPSADSKLVAAKDEVVKESVEKALATREDLRQVNVAVKNSVVRLTGTVQSVPSKLRAAVMARSTTGVDSVENDLRVKHKV
jgi:hyperosmotically inducible protein